MDLLNKRVFLYSFIYKKLYKKYYKLFYFNVIYVIILMNKIGGKYDNNSIFK